MRTETDEIRDNLKYLTLLSRDYPSQAAAASEIISTQASCLLPGGYRALRATCTARMKPLCIF